MHANIGSWKQRVAICGIFTGHAAMALIYDALPPVLVQLAEHFGGGVEGEVIAQFASSLPFFGVMLAGLLTPLLVARWGTRPVLLVALLLFGVLGSAGALIASPTPMLVTRFFLGLTAGATITCCVSYVALVFDEVRRVRMAGIMLSFGCFCGISFILLSGLVASQFGWRAPFYLHAVIAVVFVLPVLCMENGAVQVQSSGGMRRLISLKPVAFAFIIAVVMQGLIGTYLIQLAFLVGYQPFGSTQNISLIFALLGCGSMLASYSYGRWLVRTPAPVVVACGIAFVAAGTAIAAIASSRVGFISAAMVFGIGSAATQAGLFTWLMRKVPAEATPLAMGLMFTCLYFGTAAGPAAFTYLPALIGIRNLFLIFASSMVLGLIVWSAASGLRRRNAKASVR